MGSSQSLTATADVQSKLDALDKSLDKSFERVDRIEQNLADITTRMSAR